MEKRSKVTEPTRRRLLKTAALAGMATSFPSIWGAGAERASLAATPAKEPTVPEIPTQVVRFGSIPFLDGTQAIIGVTKGFFAEAGIELAPNPSGRVIATAAEVPGLLVANTVDVASLSGSYILQSLKQFPDLREFAIHTLFRGWAILANPKAGYKSYPDFVKAGASHPDAVRMTLAQLKGKRWTYPNVPGTILAVNTILKIGGVDQKELGLVPVAEPETLALMLRDQADFHLGGAPSRLELQRKGYRPILEVYDLVKGAKPSADSPESVLVFYDSWLTTTDYWRKQHDTVLRMTGVQFRISKFINQNQREALDIHVPFLNKVSGRTITLEDGKTIYEVLDPFLTFEDQQPVLNDEKSPLYYKWLLESRIKILVDAGLYRPGEITADSATIAPVVYREMVDLKAKTDQLLPQAKVAVEEARKAGKNPAKAQDLLKKGESLYAAYQFLDAQRFVAVSRMMWKSLLGEWRV